VSTGHECNVTFSPDGASVYFNRPDTTRHSNIYVSTFQDGHWIAAEPLNFSEPGVSDLDPFMAPDGSRLYFASTRAPGGGTKDDHDIWYANREGNGWSAPVHTGTAVNSMEKEGYPSVTSNGVMYFFSEREGGVGDMDLYRSAPDGGTFGRPENLRALNTPLRDVSPYVSPDERYMIFYHVDDARNADLYVSYRAQGAWGAPEKLNGNVDTAGDEVCPTVSPDGRYLFFARAHDGKIGIYEVGLAEAGVRTGS
jgi:Tol biopolymer transport system component